jgi:hypothetical protein
LKSFAPDPITAPSAGRSRTRAAILLLSLLSLLVLLAACRGREGPIRWGNEIVLAGNAVLECSPECATRGMCGVSPERGEVILLSSWGPATWDFDLAVTSLTPVTIITYLEEPVVEVVTNIEFPLNYYMVDIPERGPGWVAGWCLRTP